MDIVDRLNDAINRFYGKEPAGLLQEAKDDLKWLNKKHAELIDDNERLRQQNAELLEALQTISEWQPSSTTQPRQKIIDSMQFYAHLSITKVTGGE